MQKRFYALDVFRGATVALMILVNNPGSWSHIYAPLEHAPWHGWTLTDLVFPFFLFAVGNAMAFVLPQLEANGNFWTKIIKRSILIFLIGFLLSWFPFVKYNEAGTLVAKNLAQIRIFGVLQRIAVCYFFAGVIVHFFKVRGTFVVSAFLLLLYWWLCIYFNPSDPYSLAGWFGTNVDKQILGEAHMYKGEGVPFDPEGIASTLAAIVQVCFGYLIGRYIIEKGNAGNMLRNLFVIGGVLLLTGYAWGFVFPINKKIWTSSYTVFTTGFATILLGVFIFLFDVKKISKNWGAFFNVFGKNALFIFTLSGVLPRLSALVRIPVKSDSEKNFTSPLGWIYEHVCKPILPTQPEFGSLLYALLFIIFMWSLAYILHKKKIYIKV